MEAASLETFIAAAQAWFSRLTGEGAEVGAPYPLDEEDVLLDYTGIIGISGARRGGVCFSTSRELLEGILGCLGESDLSEESLADLAGEVASTLAGNARRDFGESFLISAPVILRGRPRRLRELSDRRGFVIPIRWRATHSFLAVCLD